VSSITLNTHVEYVIYIYFNRGKRDKICIVLLHWNLSYGVRTAVN